MNPTEVIMTIPFAEGFALPVSQGLMDILSQELEKSGMGLKGQFSLVFNFRDPNYGPVRGGFHPVEIRLLKRRGRWQFDYVTDFSYQGPEDMAELVKDIDFNFLSKEFYLIRYGQMGPASARELYKMWESNFVDYYQMGVFTVSVSG